MTQRTLFVATGNAGKLRDFTLAAQAISAKWRIKPLPNLANIPAPPETGETFLDNAQSKALYYAQYAPGALVLADDSGLAVDALGGAPGVYSARYAERLGLTTLPDESSAETLDARNNRALLRELARTATPPYTARYLCALAVVTDTMMLAHAEDSVPGEILPQGRGIGGFGYDPHFLLPSLGQTMAELDPKTRLSLSHRGAALRQLLPQLTH